VATEDKIKDHLPELFEHLLGLARGGGEERHIKRAPAATITKREWERKPDGSIIERQVPVYPDKDPDELVVVEEVTEIFGKDRYANMYLMNRILGTTVGRADAALAIARELLAREQLPLVRAQTETQISQKKYTDEQTEAFRRASITPEVVQQLLLPVVQTPMALLQSLSGEDLVRLGQSQSERQAWLVRFAEKLAAAQEEAMEGVYGEVIPASFEAEREEGKGEGEG